jgi:hypothetical protein
VALQGQKSSSGTGLRQQDEMHYGEDFAHARTNQQSWRMPKNRTDGKWLMTQPIGVGFEGPELFEVQRAINQTIQHIFEEKLLKSSIPCGHRTDRIDPKWLALPKVVSSLHVFLYLTEVLLLKRN